MGGDQPRVRRYDILRWGCPPKPTSHSHGDTYAYERAHRHSRVRSYPAKTYRHPHPGEYPYRVPNESPTCHPGNSSVNASR